MIDFVSTIILVVGFVDDIRSRKIHNALLIGLLVAASIFIFALRGLSGLGYGCLGFAIALGLMLPLTLFGALGAGDMKLFAVFGFTSDPMTILQVFVCSLVAGAAIGLVRAALGGQLMTVLKTTALMAVNRSTKPTGEFNIPYSAALLLGWVAHWSLLEMGSWQ